MSESQFSPLFFNALDECLKYEMTFSSQNSLLYSAAL